ncbi:MAG: hypothetical protein V1754_08885 [Pseudomonadota bacterium]
MIEKTIFVARSSLLDLATNEFQRLYFGNEFCEQLIPSLSAVQKAVQHCAANKLAFSLVTPFVTNAGIEKVSELFAWLKQNQPGCEVIVNDHGVLSLLQEDQGVLEPVFGRLLTKQKRDPRLAKLITTPPQKPRAFKQKEGYCLILPKKIPNTLVSYYQETNLNVSVIQDFLAKQSIKRAELDNLFQGMHLDFVKADLSASLYVPFGYVTTTRLCAANPFKVDKPFACKITSCNKECQEYTIQMTHPTMPNTLYQKGNTLFYKNEHIPSAQWLEEHGVNRLVFQPEIPM